MYITKPMDFIENKLDHGYNMFTEQYMAVTKDFSGDLNKVFSASCPNGGPIAITDNPYKVSLTAEKDETWLPITKDNILIYESLGG